MKIKLMLVDNQLVVRQGLKALLAKESDIEVAAEYADHAEAMEMLKKIKPDLIVMETGNLRSSGNDITKLIQEASSVCQVMILTNQSTKSQVRDALQAGARGYVLKTASFAEVVSAIRAVYQKSYYLSPEISAEIIHTFVKKKQKDMQGEPYDRLSRRERQVFKLIAEGKTTDEIAHTLTISPKTVAKHRMNIMEKLQLKNTATLVRYAAQIGILDV